MFDWRMFLDRHGIPYVEAGGKVQRGNIGIACPWCDSSDHMDHLGISVEGRGYHCWKGGQSHSGKAPQRLIVALLGCSQHEADRIVDVSSTASFARNDDTFADDALKRLGMQLTSTTYPMHRSAALELLDEFRVIIGSHMDKLLVLPYLNDRGYSNRQAVALAKRFNLMFALNGRYGYRVIIPVYQNNVLVTWTGRSIRNGEELRYKSLSTDPEKAYKEGLPTALQNIKDTLFDQDRISSGGDTLVVSEGPFDAMRVSFFGEPYGIIGTAFFGKEPRLSQIELLYNIVPKYRRVVGLFDRGAEFETFLHIPGDLGIQRMDLPLGVKDPGDLTQQQFYDLFDIV